ncbi:hypothetical protein JCGZ_18178 [Jatropha curcas]|uniref:Uncharacterized protein n=1 Tax=Jatropha curcas TaxID=180498 RepID=A0A067LE74_JATCU|nr:hypothetical protein JCGZ_18178 [Jatropha curcas]
MAHIPEIPTSAYTPEMDILGVIPDIPVFEGDRVPVSRNTLTPGMRPLQLLSVPGFDFPIRHDTDAMRSFQSEGLTSKGVRWICPWRYIARVIVSSCMICVPLCGLTKMVAYYPSRVARLYGHHQVVPDYA